MNLFKDGIIFNMGSKQYGVFNLNMEIKNLLLRVKFTTALTNQHVVFLF